MDEVLLRLLADLPSTALLAYLIYSLVATARVLAGRHQDNIEEAVTILKTYLELMERREARMERIITGRATED